MKFLKSPREDKRDKIIAYLKDPEANIDLTEKDKQLLAYYVDAYTVYRNYTSIPDTIKILVKLSTERGEPISDATARRYIYDALDVFGMASEVKREAIRHLTAEIIKDAIDIAKNQKDAKTMIYGAEKLAKLYGSDDPEAPNFDLLEPHIYEIMADPETLKVLRQLTQHGPIDLDAIAGNVMNHMAEDATEISDGTETEN